MKRCVRQKCFFSPKGYSHACTIQLLLDWDRRWARVAVKLRTYCQNESIHAASTTEGSNDQRVPRVDVTQRSGAPAKLLKHDAICDKVFVPHKAHVHLTQEKFSVRDVDSNANNRCRPLPTDAASPRRAILRAQRVQDLRKHGRATVLDHRSPVSVLALCPVRVEPHGEGRVGARLGWIAEW